MNQHHRILATVLVFVSVPLLASQRAPQGNEKKIELELLRAKLNNIFKRGTADWSKRAVVMSLLGRCQELLAELLTQHPTNSSEYKDLASELEDVTQRKKQTQKGRGRSCHPQQTI